jgi:hypothetical protein
MLISKSSYRFPVANNFLDYINAFLKLIKTDKHANITLASIDHNSYFFVAHLIVLLFALQFSEDNVKLINSKSVFINFLFLD